MAHPTEHILEVLADGEWHESAEVCPPRCEDFNRQLHLLKIRGYKIVMKPGADTWAYRLEGCTRGR